MRTKYAICLLFLILGLGTSQKDPRTEFFPKLEEKPEVIPAKENLWVFILAGQSNMAGRGKVEPMDTIPDPRILTINKTGEVILAKEPLHFYEPTLTGLDCGLSFGKELLKYIPDSVSILLIPTAVGGSGINQWISDETYRNVPLFTNFKEKTAIGKHYGTVKAILWHQGESDAASVETIKIYDKQLAVLFGKFRAEVGYPNLPIFMGRLGSYSKTDESWQAINSKMEDYQKTDPYAHLIQTKDLNHKGDFVHFDSEGQREMGKRYANEFIQRRTVVIE
ncbi:sialate O-acetylesterase [Algoriphagus sp. AK58]|uniref:sialate O-acetylesterase n=1 Tax=Algoriphagus sp. AK58 TaxID=1406877 RepID=UPI001650C75A|nr:sialate O-acetylesterase [Algoriphagus sp. AK58]MBC6369151.1 sialate O-acetylesterase [Algoriphagus sp. AK58]